MRKALDKCLGLDLDARHLSNVCGCIREGRVVHGLGHVSGVKVQVWFVVIVLGFGRVDGFQSSNAARHQRFGRQAAYLSAET